MEWIVVRDYDAMSEEAARRIIERMKAQPDLVLGLATGSTPVGTYRRLVDAFRRGEISFARVRTVNLDEYVGLAPDHPQSYARFMREQLFDHVDLPADAWDIPRGTAADLEAECARYEAHIRELGGIDLQLLGIGTNGHIGFNEPGTPFDARTHVVALTASTREANARFFERPEDVPTHAVTMGLGTILEAREILLLASGPSKREAIRRLYHEGPSPDLPASALKHHPRVTVIVDEAAAADIR